MFYRQIDSKQCFVPTDEGVVVSDLSNAKSSHSI